MSKPQHNPIFFSYTNKSGKSTRLVVAILLKIGNIYLLVWPKHRNCICQASYQSCIIRLGIRVLAVCNVAGPV